MSDVGKVTGYNNKIKNCVYMHSQWPIGNDKSENKTV